MLSAVRQIQSNLKINPFKESAFQ